MKNIPTLSVLFWINTNRIIDGQASVYCRLTVGGRRTEISLQRTIPVDQWDRGKVIGKTAAAKSLDDYMSVFKTNALQHFNNLVLLKKEITIETLKNSILGIEKEEDRKKCFSEMAKMMNKEFKDKIGKGDRSDRTLKRHEISQNFFMQFLKEEKGLDDVLLEKLDVSYCYDFEHFLSIKINQSNNTYMKHIKNVKQVLTFCVNKCQLPKNPFQSFKCTYIEPKITLLEQHEVDKIWNHPMPIQRLQEVRDGYIFCCYTAYAFTDSQALQMDHIIMSLDGEYWICKDRTKTETAENVMLLPIPKKIIEKYKNHPDRKKGFLLPQISLTHFNGYLKEIATLCGVNKELTSHTARYTFATTITLENDVPIETVSKQMGHKAIRTTQRYAKVTKRKMTNNMQMLRDKLYKISDTQDVEATREAV